MRKPAFCMCKNKGADQLHGYCAADLHICFHFIDSTISLLLNLIRNFKRLTIVCGCTARFMSDPKDRFSCDAAHALDEEQANLSLAWLQTVVRLVLLVVWLKYRYRINVWKVLLLCL